MRFFTEAVAPRDQYIGLVELRSSGWKASGATNTSSSADKPGAAGGSKRPRTLMRNARRGAHLELPVEQLVTQAVVGQVVEVVDGPRRFMRSSPTR